MIRARVRARIPRTRGLVATRARGGGAVPSTTSGRTDLDAAPRRTTATIREVLQRGAFPLVVGGDDSIPSWVLGQLPDEAPWFVTIDLDGLYPSIAPGVGWPQPGGLTYLEVATILRALARRGAWQGSASPSTCPRWTSASSRS